MRQTRVATAAAFATAGLFFVLYPAIRPFSDETSLQAAAAWASTAWVVSHSLAIVAFILLALGLLGVYLELQQSAQEPLLRVTVVTAWIGVGLTLPLYGAEVFGLHALGQEALKKNDTTFVALAGDVRGEPGIWFIVIGLLAIGVATVMLAVAVWRSGVLRKWSAIPLAAGVALYLPQFMTPQPVRVAHGLLMTVGCGLIAWDLLASRR